MNASQPTLTNQPSRRFVLSLVLLLVGVVLIAVVLLLINGPGVEGGPTDLSREASLMCHQFVKDSLKAPSSAKFPSAADDNVIADADKGEYTVASYVDADNSFGASIRTYYTCKLWNVGGDQWKLLDLQFDR